jgi:hypothetical protein
MKKQNLSKEMKQRLRQEYYGLGGAENKVGGTAAAAAFVVRQTGPSSLCNQPHTLARTDTVPFPKPLRSSDCWWSSVVHHRCRGAVAVPHVPVAWP